MSASFHAARRESNTSTKLFTSSAEYFAIVFGAGFVFGTVRVMWLVPTVGVRIAELTELPLMLAVVFFAARWVNRRFLAERDQSARGRIQICRWRSSTHHFLGFVNRPSSLPDARFTRIVLQRLAK